MKVAFVGVGTMGSLMAVNLVSKGHVVYAWDIQEERLRKIVAQGIQPVRNAREAAEKSEAIIMMMPESGDTEIALFSLGGISEGLRDGMVVMDMGTGSPAKSKEFAVLLEKRGVAYLDAPVSGGVGKAKDGTLSIMASGDERAYHKCLPLLQDLGSEVFYVGASGNGHTIKLINNMLMGINLAGICEGMVLGVKAGVDPKLLLNIINSSSGESYSSKVKIPTFVFKRDFAGGFKVKLQHKDMNLAETLARELQVPTIMSGVARQYFLAAMADGLEDQDTSAIITLLEKLTGVEVKI
jgi:3-hydroxyisobutyrate dehydrogenase-like beta-hydroxyacid dehydrogenase